MSTPPSSPPATTPQSVTEGENENATPNRFVPQCFLLDFYPKFVNANAKKEYPNFAKFNTNPATSINLLMNRGKGFAINQLTPAQLSLLVPKFRLFKIRGESEKEFYFDDATSKISDIGQARSSTKSGMRVDGKGRPIAVGFKSFTWEDIGTDPGNQGAAFKAELTIALANMDSLFARRNGVAIAELLNVYPGKKAKVDEKYDPAVVRCDVGWSLGTKASKGLSKNIIKAINASTISLFLSLKNHDLTINDNGTLELKVEYIASTETKVRSPSSDIFFDATASNNADWDRAQLLEKQLQDQYVSS